MLHREKGRQAKMKESSLRWYKYVQRCSADTPVSRCETMNEMQVKCERGILKNIWRETIRKKYDVYDN